MELDYKKVQELQPVHEVIVNLLFSYSTKQEPPGIFEIMSVESALPYVKEYMDGVTYQSTLEWVQRHKERYEDV